MAPSHAVALLLILGLCVNVLVLGAERRPLAVDWRGLRPAMLAALPGLPIGAVLVRVLPADVLRVAIGVIVCVLVAHRLLRRAAESRRPPGRATAGVAGFSAGVLTTSTTTNGPPLALWLGGRGLQPAIVRDTVSAAFLMLDLVGLVVVLAVVGRELEPSTLIFVRVALGALTLVVVALVVLGRRAVVQGIRAVWLPFLIPVVLLGHLAGSWVFRRLPAHRYDQILLIAVAAAGALSIASGLR